MDNLKEAWTYNTYKEYYKPRQELGLCVIPEKLFDAFKKDLVDS